MSSLFTFALITFSMLGVMACIVPIYDEFWSSLSCDSLTRSSVSGDADGILSSLRAGSLTTYQHILHFKR